MKSSIGSFRALIPQIKEAIELQVQVALSNAAEKIAEDATSKIGVEQPEWERLADSTENEKKRKGQDYPAPLKASGDLKKSIVVEIEGHKAVIGSNDPVAEYQEGGTSHVPPRPFLLPSAIENEAFIEHEFEMAIRRAFGEGI